MRNLSADFSKAVSLFKVICFKKRIPLAVGWGITKRCNYRCKYCAIWKEPSEELNTEEVYKIIAEMSAMGTKRLILTGGEPLLRDDIGKIINYAVERGISVGLNSNGALVKEKLPELRKLTYLALSLEGPEEIHDTLRQAESFQDVLRATRIARENNIAIIFQATINKLNFEYIDYLLEFTFENNAQIIFQPATLNLLNSVEENPVSLSQEIYYQTLNKIIVNKSGKYNITIRNSITGLKHLLQWPNLKKVICAGGRICCRIEVDGNVYHCARKKSIIRLISNSKGIGFKKAFYRLPIIHCEDCCCAMFVEANYILQFDIPAVISAHLFEKKISIASQRSLVK